MMGCTFSTSVSAISFVSCSPWLIVGAPTGTREWTLVRTIGPSPEGRYGHAAAMVGSKFFIFGGQKDDGGFMNDLCWFDLQKRESALGACSFGADSLTLLFDSPSSFAPSTLTRTLVAAHSQGGRTEVDLRRLPQVGCRPSQEDWAHHRHIRRLHLRVSGRRVTRSRVRELIFRPSLPSPAPHSPTSLALPSPASEEPTVSITTTTLGATMCLPRHGWSCPASATSPSLARVTPRLSSTM